MSTKFCYYNNYNANQPRHYCKNCQRYWTAGGIVRRVPIGAGRRKIRNSSTSHCHHTMVPEALQAAKLNPLNKLHDTVWGKRAAMLSFGHDSPLCDTKASMMNIPEKTQNSIPNVFNKTKQNRFASFGRDDNGNDHSNGVSVTTSTSSESIGQCSSYKSMDKRFENFPPRFPSSPWPYSRNSAMPPPTFHPPGNPLSPKTAPAYWDCFSLSRNNMPGISPKSSVSYSVFSPSFGPNSHLGKHSRDGSIINPTNSQEEKLRIGSEAAKSSMFSKLVSMNDKANSLAGGGFCKDFPSKRNDNNNHIVEEASTVSRVNQAGLSRSDLLPFFNKPSWEFQ